MELFCSIMCEHGNQWFCHISSARWILLTTLLFLASIPLNLIEDLRKFKWVNMSALFTLAALLIIGVYILLFKDLTGYSFFDSDLVRWIFPDSKNDRVVFSTTRIIKVITITCFSIESVPLLFPIINRMKEKRFFNRYLFSVSFTAFIVTSCLGCLVYSKMGAKIPRIFLKALIHEFPLVKILLAFYSLFLFLNY